MKPNFVSEKEAAELLLVEVKVLRAWRRRGVGPEFRKFESMVRYPWNALEEFIGFELPDPDDRSDLISEAT